MTSYRDEAANLYTRAKAALDAHSSPFEDDPIKVAAVGILAGLLAIDDDGDLHETAPLPPAAEYDPTELDDADTIEQPTIGHIPHRDIIAGLGPTWDNTQSAYGDDEVAFQDARWAGGRDRISQLLHDDT